MGVRPSWLCFYTWLKVFAGLALLINLVASAMNFFHYVNPEVTTIYTIAGAFAETVRILLVFVVILGVYEVKLAYRIFPFLESFFGLGLTFLYIAFSNLGTAGVADALVNGEGIGKFLPISCYILMGTGGFILMIGCVGGKGRIEKSRKKLEVEAEAESLRLKELSFSQARDSMSMPPAPPVTGA
eukprot:TRINITY_DN677_c0_g1_i1.p2 TRINITY_DN677_c0_g1~~TRINITY_DN677_c0_g1_i1.p2  ORF type:complete len:185 (+),score=60.62 TRINITY_DN677_c0_g1_i1:79-633(+)